MKKTFVFLILALFSIAMLLLLACDLQKPNTENMTKNCEAFILCMWVNQKNPDKSVCASLGPKCGASNDFITCIETKSKTELSFKECLLLLRQ